MRRFPAPIVLGVLLALPALGGVAAAASGPPPRARLGDFACRPALDPPGRMMSVTSVMRPVPGTVRMAVNFRLLERTPTSGLGYQTVTGPGLGVWITKDFGQQPGDVWRVIHPVSDLAAPAAYRFVVAFRWTGAAGRVLANATRISHACRQPDLRPDLVIDGIAVRPTPGPGTPEDTYAVRVRNAGLTAAGPFLVALSDSGTIVDGSVPRLPAHASRLVRLVGPVCSAADPPTVTVDPNEQIDVSSRARAVATVVCPAAAGG